MVSLPQALNRFALPLKKVGMRWACHPAVGRAIAQKYNNRIPNRGCLIETSSPCVLPSMKAALFWGSYEKSEVLMVQRYLGSDLDVIEIGSSIGVVASHVACRLSENKRLICVEANPKLLPAIERNVGFNSPQTPLQIVHAAIDYSGSAEILLDIGRRNIDSRISDLPTSTTMAVPTTTLSELCSALGNGSYRLVADIEGAELGMITRDAKALGACQQIIIELHHVTESDRTVAPQELAQRLVRLGFDQTARRGDVFVFDRAASHSV
jgi:FkbM family methyltransferase